MSKTKSEKNPIYEMYDYIDDILSGKILSCKWVKLACQRHLDLLKKSKTDNFNYYFDEDKAQEALSFIGNLKHTLGEWKGHYFKLSPSQVFMVGYVFGWLNKITGLRMVRTVYIEVCRKFGKSFLMSAIALYMFAADGENQAEVYALATKAEQARRVFDQSKLIVKQNTVLKKYISIFRDSLVVKKDNGVFKPLASDTKKLDSLNISCAVLDELHAHPSSLLFDLVDTATGSRRNPLLLSITTAGQNKESICWTVRKYVTKILDGVFDDLTYFGIIYCIDNPENWNKKEHWVEANPNLDINTKLEDLERKFNKAQNEPSFRPSFKRLHLGVWGEHNEEWISSEQWGKCQGPFDVQKTGGLEEYIEFLKNKTCFAGLDLSSTTDLSALSLVFPPQNEDKHTYVLSFSFIPEDTIQEKSKTDKVLYNVWRDQGLIETTQGNVIDYRMIMKKIIWCCENFNIKELCFDSWNSSQLITELQSEGSIEVVGIRQGYKSLSPPTKELEKLVLEGSLIAAHHPVLSWCLSNVKLLSDPAENVKIMKQSKNQRIDPIAAAINALARVVTVSLTPQTSIYEEQELLVI